MPLPRETNSLKRTWIRFWYNNVTRFLVVLLPSYALPLVAALTYFGVPGEMQRHFVTVTYLAVLGWAMVDNDYTQLERIGLDVDRRPLKDPREAPAACHWTSRTQN